MKKHLKVPAQLVLISCFILLLASSASPQGDDRISGKVVDQQGGVLPGATVVAEHVDTGLARTTTTNAAGHYVVHALAPGNYTVTVSMTGFATYRREGLILVTDTNGDIANGDWITTSTRAGHGQRQDSDLRQSHTAAKATESVNWDDIDVDPETGFKWMLITCTYHAG